MKILLGGAHCYWHAVVIGNDILVRGAIATWFGDSDANDPTDDGQTASGVRTKGQKGMLGCALPMHGFPRVQSTLASPLPRIPWFTVIEISTPEGGKEEAPLIDIGPSVWTNHAIDCLQETFQRLGGDIKRGIQSVDYRIPNGANYL